MFYSEGVLARKGPLARVWLAAHWERRLTKSQFLQTNIQDCVVAIIGGEQPPMALRLTGQLLLGVVKIYSRKTRYLMEECNEAVYKIKTTFRPGDVDLREDQVTANLNAITLPDVVNELDMFLLPDLGLPLRPWDAALNPAASQNVSRPQDITLRESSDLLSSVGGSNDSPGMFNANFDILAGDDARGVEFNLDLDGERRDKEDLTSPMEVEVGRDAAPEQAFAPEVGGGTPSADKTFDDGDGDLLMPADEHEPPAFENVEAEFGIAPETFDNEASALSFSLDDQPSPLANRESNVMFEVPDIVVEEVPPEEIAETPLGKKTVPRKRRLMLDENTQLSEALIKRHLVDTSDITGKLSFLPFSRKNLQLSNLTVEDYVDSRPRALAEELRSLFDPVSSKKLPVGRDWRNEEEEDAVVPVDGREESVQPVEVAVHREKAMPEDFNGAGVYDDTADLSFVADAVDDHADQQAFAPVAEHPVTDIFTSPIPGSAASLSSTTPAGVFVTTNLPQLSRHFRTPPPAPGDRRKLSIYDSGDLADELQSDPGLLELESEASQRVFSKTALKTMGFLRTQFAAAANVGRADCEPELSYKSLSSGARRGDAVRLFYEMLLLTTKDVVGVSQDEAYGDIMIRAKGELFCSGASQVSGR